MSEPLRIGVASPWVFAVQWHPEFQDPADRSLLSTTPLRDLFLEAAIKRRHRRSAGGRSIAC